MQNKISCLVVTAICLTTLSLSVHARSVSGAGGRSASASAGSRSAETARGGSASWERGSGTTVETAGGRSASTSATAYRPPAAGVGGVGRGYPGVPAAGAPGYGAAGYHPPVPAYGYRPPANYGYSSGQVAGAAAVGVAVGAMAGSAAASQSAPPPSTVIVQQAPAQPALPLGSQLPSLPVGCTPATINAVQYFQCGANWLILNGGYFQVIPRPY